MSSPAGTVIFVLGMHRSGTSAFAGALHALGVHLGDHLLPPDPDDNPLGYFELPDAVTLNDRLLAALGRHYMDLGEMPAGWQERAEVEAVGTKIRDLLKKLGDESPLFAIKDPRLCRTLPVWKRAAQAVGLRLVFAHVFRHPVQVVRSLQKRDPDYTMAEGLLLWLNHVLEACQSIQQHHVSWVEFDSLLRQPAARLSAVADELGLRWPVEEAGQGAMLEGILKPGLRHFDGRDLTYPEEGLCKLTQRVYRALQARERGEDPPGVFNGKINTELTQLHGYSILAEELQRGPKRTLESAKRSAAEAIRHRDDYIVAQQEQMDHIQAQMNHIQERMAHLEAEIRARDQHIAFLETTLNSPLKLIRRLGRLALNRLVGRARASEASAHPQQSPGQTDTKTSSDASGSRQ
ncbi:MAG: hypothetical protein QNJ82_18530 [Gammaproteobacteria bacterium]|nr:hypothetical protein [Gammaproteobacteria bacterium]